MTNNPEIKIHYNLDDINELEWNHLARHSSVFYDYGWFKTFHHLLGSPLFIAAYRNNSLVGLLPGFVVSDTSAYLYHNPKDALFCRNELDFIEFALRSGKMKTWFGLKIVSKCSKIIEPLLDRVLFPAYVVISPRGFVGDFLFESQEVAYLILDRLDLLCCEKAIRTKCFMWISKENSRLTQCLNKRGYKELTGELDFNMDLKWNSIEALMKDLVSERRWRIKKDIRKFDSENYSVKYREGNCDILDNIDEMADLAKKHAVACGDLMEEHDIKEIYTNFCRHMKERVYSVIAWNNNDIEGFSIGFKKAGRLYPKFEGYDPFVSEKKGLHYNLNYYKHIVKGIEKGEERICFGAGDPESKLTRGCKPTTLSCYYEFVGSPMTKKIFSKYTNWINYLKMRTYRMTETFKAWKRV